MARLYLQRKDTDPSDWQTHVRRSLVPEVRDETLRFYGPTDCLEAQYPGLDYAKPAHRLRLDRFPYHRRLFRVFDELRLTGSEIQRLCKWEGTRWAKETYETTNGMKIKDTTWDGIVDARCRGTTATLFAPLPEKSQAGAKETSDNEMDYEDDDDDAEVQDSDEMEAVSEEESEDEVDEVEQSIGVQLNERLLAATEARARGEDATMDPDWEQWLKEAAERDAVPNVPQVHRPSSAPQTIPAQVYWGQEIPGYLEDNPTPENVMIQTQVQPPPQYMPRPPETYSLLVNGAAISSASSASPPVEG